MIHYFGLGKYRILITWCSRKEWYENHDERWSLWIEYPEKDWWYFRLLGVETSITK